MIEKITADFFVLASMATLIVLVKKKVDAGEAGSVDGSGFCWRRKPLI